MADETKAPSCVLGGRTLALRGLQMRHARAGILQKVRTAAEREVDAAGISPARMEAMIDIVYAAVDEQITRADFDALVNALGVTGGPQLIAATVGKVLTVSDFTEAGDGAGEAPSPAALTAASMSPGSTA